MLKETFEVFFLLVIVGFPALVLAGLVVLIGLEKLYRKDYDR